MIMWGYDNGDGHDDAQYNRKFMTTNNKMMQRCR